MFLLHKSDDATGGAAEGKQHRLAAGHVDQDASEHGHRRPDGAGEEQDRG